MDSFGLLGCGKKSGASPALSRQQQTAEPRPHHRLAQMPQTARPPLVRQVCNPPPTAHTNTNTQVATAGHLQCGLSVFHLTTHSKDIHHVAVTEKTRLASAPPHMRQVFSFCSVRPSAVQNPLTKWNAFSQFHHQAAALTESSTRVCTFRSEDKALQAIFRGGCLSSRNGDVAAKKKRHGKQYTKTK